MNGSFLLATATADFSLSLRLRPIFQLPCTLRPRPMYGHGLFMATAFQAALVFASHYSRAGHGRFWKKKTENCLRVSEFSGYGRIKHKFTFHVLAVCHYV